MTPDSAFTRSLSNLDKDLFAVWYPLTQRWMIRRWVSPHRRGDEQDLYTWGKKSALVRIVCYRDKEYNDIGYHPLDERVIYALKRSRHLGLHPERVAREVDESNKKLEAEWEADNAEISKEMATSVWSHYREATVDLGERNGR